MGQVYIGKIIDIQSIENADRVVQSTVVCGVGGKWKGVTVKGDFNVGDCVEVYLQDSLMPQIDRFSFLKHKVIRIARLRGAYSECLIMPLTVAGEVGDDISGLIGVTKYEKPLPAGRWFNTKIVGSFPSFLPKTDEPNFQKYGGLVGAIHGKPYYITQKMDGTSITLYRTFDGLYHVCSRNYEIETTDSFQPYMTFPEGYAIQMEWCGNGIQGNTMGLKENRGYVFNVFHFGHPNPHYLSGYDNFLAFTSAWHLPTVPLIEHGDNFCYTEDQIRELATGKYSNGKPQEGIVIRPKIEEMVWTPDGLMRLSFKAINPDYKN